MSYIITTVLVRGTYYIHTHNYELCIKLSGSQKIMFTMLYGAIFLAILKNSYIISESNSIVKLHPASEIPQNNHKIKDDNVQKRIFYF